MGFKVFAKGRRTNYPLLIIMFALIVFGLVILYSVSAPAGYGKEQDSLMYVRSQMMFTGAGLVICLVLNYVDVHIFNNKWVCIISYATSLVIIILTKVAGYSLNGAKRWILIGGRTLQTSEIAKILLILSYASYRSWILRLREEGKLTAPTKSRQLIQNVVFDFIIPVALAAVVDIFILIQPHVSCTLIIAFVIFMCTVASGIDWKSWLIGLIILGLAAGVGILGLLVVNPTYVQKNFQHVFKRIAIFQSDDEDAQDNDLTEDDTRQVDNAHNALGSGGMWGVGMGESRSKYFYVSEAQNDYIFSIFVEEMGFMGGLILILLYMGFFVSGVLVVLNTDSVFTRVLATGYTMLITIEVLLNLAVELQVLPSTGVTLPFVSFGGTAQLFLLTGYGMLLCVARSGVIKPGEKMETRQ